jgi:hypothetical protein
LVPNFTKEIFFWNKRKERKNSTFSPLNIILAYLPMLNEYQMSTQNQDGYQLIFFTMSQLSIILNDTWDNSQIINYGF